MVLTADAEALIHLIARAFAKTSGNQAPHVFADVVLEHAKSLAESDTAAVVADVKEAVEPAPPAAEPPLTTESVMEKVEGFVDHLLHPQQPPSA